VPNQTNPIDARDDFFRIRLVCILLEGCGMCFDRGSLKKKLDAFLTFFQVSFLDIRVCFGDRSTDVLLRYQYYVLCKEELPLDVGFMLSDTIEVSPCVVLGDSTLTIYSPSGSSSHYYNVQNGGRGGRGG
jgi:regulator of nonsense transcripts 2